MTDWGFLVARSPHTCHSPDVGIECSSDASATKRTSTITYQALPILPVAAEVVAPECKVNAIEQRLALIASAEMLPCVLAISPPQLHLACICMSQRVFARSPVRVASTCMATRIGPPFLPYRVSTARKGCSPLHMRPNRAHDFLPYQRFPCSAGMQPACLLFC